MLTGDAQRRKELDEKKDFACLGRDVTQDSFTKVRRAISFCQAQLKKRLDNQSLRSRMQSLHRKLFAALDRRKARHMHGRIS